MKEGLIHPSPGENGPERPPLKRNWPKPFRHPDQSSRSEKGHEIWLLTLSDLLLLLMIFFVLLFGMSLQQQPQGSYSLWPQVAASTMPEETLVDNQPAYVLDVPSQEVLVTIEADLRTILGKQDGKEEVSLTRHADHLILAFPEKILFESGRAHLKTSAQPILDQVASLASAHPDLLVEVQGHTDDRPINTKRYPSNWELSVDRATQVVKRLIGLGLNPAQISMKGFGEYRTLYPNDSDSNRRQNRRVEIQFSLAPQS
jgi:chemotaxis protein MotB